MNFCLQLLLCTLFFSLVSCSSTPDEVTSKSGASTKQSENVDNKKTVENQNVGKDNLVKCNLKNDKRKIQIKNNDKGCKVLYTKFGKEKSIASSVKKNNFYCNSILKRVKDNLVTAGFKCE